MGIEIQLKRAGQIENLETSKAKMCDYIAFGSEGAVASVFVRYSNTCGVVTPESIQLTDPIMIQDISKHIAVSRETVSRIVNKWKEQGIIDNQNKHYILKDMNYFRRLLVCEQCGVENCAIQLNLPSLIITIERG